jgi:hypothetical protein
MTEGEVASRGPAEQESPLSWIPGQAVIAEVVEARRTARKRSLFARIFGVSPLPREARDSYDIAVAQIEVGRLLAELGPDWTIVHEIPVGENGAKIDHLVIGPRGVFIVDTTVHQGLPVWVSQRAFIVNDVRLPLIRNMEFEMGRVERLLSTAAGHPVEVSGILAVVGPKSLDVHGAQRDVAVVEARNIGRWIVGRARVLTPESVDAVVAAATSRSTWHGSASPQVDPVELRSQFGRVTGEIKRALNRQRAWATAVTAIAAGAFILVTYTILISALGL